MSRGIISLHLWLSKRTAAVAAIGVLLVIEHAQAETFSIGTPVQVSPAGEIVAEFSSATAPGDPQLIAASAIKRLSPAKTLCAVYVSRDGGITWDEVPAWPDGGLQAL